MSGPGPASRLLHGALTAAAVAAAVLFAVFVLLRLPYPFELEWMEGAMVDHAARVRSGLDVYASPGPDHVALLYTPLLYWCGAIAAAVLGDGFAALRLVSVLATLGCAALLFVFVRDRTRRRDAGIWATGLFLGGYGWLQTWYDLARNDTLMLCLVLATVVLLQRPGRRATVLAAAAATLAFLAKQTALLWLPAIALGCAALDRRRGMLFAGTTALLLGGTVLGCHLATDGWFTFFVFTMARGHVLSTETGVAFVAEDLVPVLPLLAGAAWFVAAQWRAGERRDALWLGAVVAGGLCASCLSRMHLGGFDNVLMYAFAALCAVAPLLLAKGPPRAVALLLLAQFALLTVDVRSLWQDRPVLLAAGPRHLPTAAHERANRELLAFVREQTGPVLVPFHGHLAAMAGKPRGMHAQAVWDLARGIADPPAAPVDAAQAEHRAIVVAFVQRCADALREHSYRAIVLDAQGGPAFEVILSPGLGAYQRSDRVLLTEPSALQPPVGMPTHSPYVWVPR
jgi:hypothetical protein